MDEEASLNTKVFEFIKKYPLFIGAIVLGLLLCVVGGLQYISSQKNTSTLQLITEDMSEATSIAVDIQGQVVSPGVKNIPAGSRLVDAIDAAGGLSENADNEYISKRLNLAQVISDGAKIYIPAEGELETNTSVLGISEIVETVSEDLPVANSDIININTASLESLDTLPRVGPVTAQKIVEGRPYGSIEELVTKKVLGQKTFEGLRDRVVSQ